MAAIAPSEARKSLGGVWAKESDRSETYEMEYTSETAWGCTRRNGLGPKRFRLAYDKDKCRVWWGESYFLDPADLVAKPQRAQWFRSSDLAKKRAAFIWIKLREARPEDLVVKKTPTARPSRPTASGPTGYPSQAPTVRSTSRPGGSAKSDASLATPAQRGPAVVSAAAAGGDGAQPAAGGGKLAATQNHSNMRGLTKAPSPEVILDLDQAMVLYKPPYWKCELPEREDSHEKGSERNSPLPPPQGDNALNLLCWVADKGLGIDPALYAEDNNPALSGTGFGPLGHRLDAETSGPMLVAKTRESQRQLKAQFHRTEVSKRYVCLVRGRVTPSNGVVQASIRTLRTGSTTRSEISSHGDWAHTSYTVIATYAAPHLGKAVGPGGEELAGCSLVACDIVSGRTHQIRVHMQHLGHPLISDDKYMPTAKALSEDRAWCPRLFLHCYRLKFKDLRGRERLVVCPLPQDLKAALMSLGAADPSGPSVDMLFDETSWQREILRPPPQNWRPSTQVLRKVMELLSKLGTSAAVPLSQLNSDPELRQPMAEEGITAIGKKWLAKHWDLFEVVPPSSEASDAAANSNEGSSDLQLKLRPVVSGELGLENDLERRIEVVRTELEDLQRQKQRAVAQEEYRQAADIKRKAEVVSAELNSLQLLLEGEDDDAAAEANQAGGPSDGGSRRATSVARTADAAGGAQGVAGRGSSKGPQRLSSETAAAFTEDVRDEELFPALVPTPSKSSLLPKRSSAAVPATTKGLSAPQRASSRPPPVEEVPNGVEAAFIVPEVPPPTLFAADAIELKDALKEFLLGKEGYVARMNEVNNDRFLRKVMAAQKPKPLTAVNKNWLKENEDTFTLLRTADNEVYVALESAARPKHVPSTPVAISKPDPQTMRRQIVQKMSDTGSQSIVYRYSTAVRTETARDLAGGGVITSWQDKFLDVLRETPSLPRPLDELLASVPTFAETMAAKRPAEARQMLVTFLKACPDVFRVEKSGFAADKGGYLVWALKR